MIQTKAQNPHVINVSSRCRTWFVLLIDTMTAMVSERDSTAQPIRT
jgi:hypothetical protein